MGVIVYGDKSYTGAGVLVVEDYRKDGERIPCVLIARNKSSQKSSDFGGSYETSHKSISVTASKELLEESCNLINVKSEILEKSNSIDIDGYRNTFYRVYVIKAQNISSKYFNNNKTIINEHPDSKRQWKETDKIYHIPISNIDFDTLLLRKTIVVKDVNGDNVILDMRLRKVLKSGEDIIRATINESPIITKKNLVKIDSGKPFLIGTHQFYAKD